MSIISRISLKSITVIVDGRVRTVSAQSINYVKLKDALLSTPQDISLIKKLSNIPAFLALETHGRVTVSGSEVRFDDVPIHGTLTVRILEHLKAGISIAPLANFLDRLMNNPNPEIHEDLYAWCESGELPFTEDGFLIAFKKVQSDYYSFHSGARGKVLYALNTIVEVPSDEVDPNRHNECSHGLHFCSFGYLNKFYGDSGKVLIVKIDPADVVAIPLDYHRQKGRTFRMEVIDEIPADEAEEAFSGRLVVSDQGSYNAAEESTAELSTHGSNCLARRSDDTVITEEEVTELLTYGGIEYAATITGHSPQAVMGWQKAMFFPDEKLGTVEGPNEEEVPAVEGPKDEVLTFERNGVYYTFKDILTEVGHDGINAYSRDEGIPRSTLQSWVKKAKEEELRLSNELKFVHKGNVYLASTISKGIQAVGQTAYSKQTGIPRSTLHGWMKKIN